METIDIKNNYDGHNYVVSAVRWVRKEEIRLAFTEIGREKFDFDNRGFQMAMLKEATLKDGKPLTDDDIAAWDGKSGDIVRRAYWMLNQLTLDEERNLKRVPSWTIQTTP